MKNFVVKGLLIGSLVATSLMAEGGMMGVEGDFSLRHQIDGEKVENSHPKSFGIKGGYNFDVAKVYAGYYYKGKNEIKDENIKLNYKRHDLVVGVDATPKITDHLKIVAGLFGGMAFIDQDSEVKLGYITRTTEGTEGGPMVGGKLGLAINFDEHSEIELGYKADLARFSNFDDVNHRVYLGYNHTF